MTEGPGPAKKKYSLSVPATVSRPGRTTAASVRRTGVLPGQKQTKYPAIPAKTTGQRNRIIRVFNTVSLDCAMLLFEKAFSVSSSLGHQGMCGDTKIQITPIIKRICHASAGIKDHRNATVLFIGSADYDLLRSQKRGVTTSASHAGAKSDGR